MQNNKNLLFLFLCLSFSLSSFGESRDLEKINLAKQLDELLVLDEKEAIFHKIQSIKENSKFVMMDLIKREGYYMEIFALSLEINDLFKFIPNQLGRTLECEEIKNNILRNNPNRSWEQMPLLVIKVWPKIEQICD